MMGSIDDTLMLAQDLSLRSDHDPVGIDPQTDGTIGEGGRHGVADTLEVDQTCRRDPLGLFDKAIKGSPRWHQAGDLPSMHIGNHPRQGAMRDLRPLRDTARFKPGIERIEIGEARQGLPEPRRASCTFFSTWPFSQPEAGLQNSGSNR